MIIASDLHLRDESAETVLGQVLPGLFDAAMQDRSRDVALLGDIYHLRYRVDVRLQNALRDELRRWSDAGITTQIIPGNHDQINVAGRNALEVLDDIQHVAVHTGPVTNSDGLWIPYRKRNEDILAAVTSLVGRSANMAGQRVAFMHHGVLGALMNDTYASEEGLGVGEFKGFNIVFCGHFHKRQVLGNVIYVGSPYQTNAGEAGQAKGYIVWDCEKYEWVDTAWGKKYHSITLNQGDHLDLSGCAPGDEVRVRTGTGVDPEKVGQQLAEAGIATHAVTPDVEPLQARLDVPEHADLSRFAQAFVGASETHLDKSKLMNVFKEVTS